MEKHEGLESAFETMRCKRVSMQRAQLLDGQFKLKKGLRRTKFTNKIIFNNHLIGVCVVKDHLRN